MDYFDMLLARKLSGGGASSEAMISDEYDSTKTYAKGDYCIYNNTLYKCKTAISTPEEWNASHWDATIVTDELSELKTDLVNLGSISNVVPYGNTPVVSIDKGGSSKIGKLVFVNIAFTVLSDASVGANTGIITVPGLPTLINNMALNLYDANGNFITGKCRMSGTIIYAGASLTAGNSYNISGFYFTT